MNIVKLIVKKFQGNPSKKEEEYFEKWIDESDENRHLFSRLETMKNKGIDISDSLDLDTEQAWGKVKQQVYAKTGREKERLSLPGIIKYAAIIMCFLGIGYGFWVYNSPLEQNFQIDKDAITLELSNGEVQKLVPLQSQTIVNAQGNILGIRNGNQLDYSNSEIKEELIYNTLNIPNGKRFKIVLSDGSIVHMNAGSSLKYPVRFIKHEKRQVFLNGEAYFEVSEDKIQPFIVTADNMNVEVLGTKFNITSYPEDLEINTVLVEGSVSLYSVNTENKEKTATILEPGYKAAWEKSEEKIDLKKVDTNIYIGWLNGKLVLKKMLFKDILKKLQRYYNVSITNEYKALDNRVFTATFDIETVEEVLDIFIEDTNFEYSIVDKKITINQPKN